MATATAPAKPLNSFKVSCPFCGDSETGITIDLNDLTACHCPACENDFSPREALNKAMATAARWEAVVQWIDMAGSLATTL